MCVGKAENFCLLGEQLGLADTLGSSAASEGTAGEIGSSLAVATTMDMKVLSSLFGASPKVGARLGEPRVSRGGSWLSIMESDGAFFLEIP